MFMRVWYAVGVVGAMVRMATHAPEGSPLWVFGAVGNGICWAAAVLVAVGFLRSRGEWSN